MHFQYYQCHQLLFIIIHNRKASDDKIMKAAGHNEIHVITA